jgi:DNA polymerase-3 subunit epsilon
MRVLLVDTETSGISYDEGARVIEVAAALYDTKYASVIESFSALIKHDKNEAEHVNGIPVGLLLEQGDEPLTVWTRFAALASVAECLVAHRAEFDQGFIDKSIAVLQPTCASIDGWDPRENVWCCTKSDFEWPNKLRGDHLVQLALGLGLGVSSAHRAMVDVDSMARILTRVQEVSRLAWFEGAHSLQRQSLDFLEPLFRRAMRPKVRVVALVPYENRDMAKEAGFFWIPERKEWYRNMPREDIAALPFKAVERPL